MLYLFYSLMQVSPIGMASASQADFGGSDSRHLLQKSNRAKARFLFFKKRESDPRGNFALKKQHSVLFLEKFGKQFIAKPADCKYALPSPAPKKTTAQKHGCFFLKRGSRTREGILQVAVNSQFRLNIRLIAIYSGYFSLKYVDTVAKII